MADIFKDIVYSILTSKKDVLQDDEDIKTYIPFIVNRALSAHQDCIFWVNEMNNFPDLDPDIQYQFLLQSIRGMKRKFQPWHKKEKIDDIEAIRKLFGYNYQKSLDALKILNEKQLQEIRNAVETGGIP